MARIFITGSSTGLGLMAAQLLIEQGHQVVLHGRNRTRAEQAMSDAAGAQAVVVGDLSQISETRSVADQVNRLGRFDAVIHNAGVGYREGRPVATEHGVPHVFATNVLAPYVLTALIERPDRLIYLSSGMHHGAELNFDDLLWTKRRWQGAQAYAESKLHDVILAFAVANRWPAVRANALEPGWVATRMGGAGATDDLSKGHLTQAWLAVSNEALARSSGEYFYHKALRAPNPIARDQTAQHRLIEACARLSGVPLPEVSDQFAAHVIAMDNEPLIPGRSYLLRAGTRTVPASITAIKYKVDINTREHLAAETLRLNDIAFCNLATDIPIAFDPYVDNRKTGAFILIDRFSNRTIGAGMIAFGLRRGVNVPWQPLLVGKTERAALTRQKPAILWFTGLSGAGKSTIANMVEQRLNARGHHTTLLDGDNIRHGLNRDLGFTEADRVENIRRVGEVAKLMVESGLIVLCSFISPYRAERDMVRGLVAPDEFIEVYVDTPLDECMRRDPKGLYAKASAGKLKNFTGIDAPYEPPATPEIHLTTLAHRPEDLADGVIELLEGRSILARRTTPN